MPVRFPKSKYPLSFGENRQLLANAARQRRTLNENRRLLKELEYERMRSAFREKEYGIRNQLSKAQTLAEVMRIFRGTLESLGIGGVNVYRYSNESTRLWSVEREDLQGISRYKEPIPILPGEKRRFINTGGDRGFPENPTDILLVDRFKELEQMNEEDRRQAEADIESDLKKYFGDNYKEVHADRQAVLREAIRYNLYVRYPGFGHYDALIMANHHAENARLVKESQYPGILLGDLKLREIVFETLRNLQIPFTAELKKVDSARQEKAQNARNDAKHQLSTMLTRAVHKYQTEKELMQMVAEALPKQFLRGLTDSYIERASVMIYVPEEGGLRIRGHYGLRDDIVTNTLVKPGEDVAGKVFLSGEAIINLDARTARIFQGLRPAQKIARGSSMSVPIRYEDHILGVLNVRSTHPFAFKTEDSRHLETLAGLLALNLKLRESINLDGLTGLLAHTQGIIRLERMFQVARENRLPLAYIMIDLDHFKQVNDQLGHQAGDLLLIEIGLMLQAFLKQAPAPVTEAIALRPGGEELGIGLLNCPPDLALKLAEDLRQRIEQKSFNVGYEMSIHKTASFGVAVAPFHARTIDDLLENADRAMYKSKKNGRNCSTLFDPNDPEMSTPKHHA